MQIGSALYCHLTIGSDLRLKGDTHILVYKVLAVIVAVGVAVDVPEAAEDALEGEDVLRPE